MPVLLSRNAPAIQESIRQDEIVISRADRALKVELVEKSRSIGHGKRAPVPKKKDSRGVYGLDGLGSISRRYSPVEDEQDDDADSGDDNDEPKEAATPSPAPVVTRTSNALPSSSELPLLNTI